MTRRLIERFRLWRLQKMDRRGTISAGERAELQRLQDEHGTIHVGDPSARYYRFGDDATKPRH